MQKLLMVVSLALSLILTGCASSTTPSPIVTDQCKVVAAAPVSPPNSNLKLPKSTPIKYTASQLKNGVSRSEIVANQSANNKLWAQDRLKLDGLQAYIQKLQDANVIGK